MSDITSNPNSPARPVLLVVDDEEGPRTSLKIVFKNDFDVHLASNGPDALQLAAKVRPSVAILDILMPGMSGVEVLRELKTMNEDLEVIMLTAYETLETARQALRLGARDYLNKPFEIPVLRAAVAHALERHRHQVELKAAAANLRLLQTELARSRQEITSDEASNVVHDLNNPLTVISGFVELLNRQVESAATLQGEELDRMKVNIARVQAQVTRCLEISRRYLGAQRHEPEERASVNEVLVDLQDLLQRHPDHEGHTLTVRELDTPASAAINRTDLLRILLNLSANALQCTELHHRVEIIAQTMEPGFDPSTFRDAEDERFVGRETLSTQGPLLAVSVRDNGPGIAPEVVEKLFGEQFTTKPAGKGTGLGLGSVKALVQQAHGAVRLSTKVGSGTTFTIFLPLRPTQ